MDIFYICFNETDLDDLDFYVETQVKEAKKWNYYIQVNVPKKPKAKGLCIGSVTIKDE